MRSPARTPTARARQTLHSAACRGAVLLGSLHQRPENVLAGHLSWSNYRLSGRPNTVRIEHHKTGALVDLPLSDRDGPLFPELTAYLDGLERLGLPIVLMKPERPSGAKVAVPRPFLLRTARNRVRAAARVGELRDDLTLPPVGTAA